MTVVNFNYPKFKYTIASTGQPGVGYKLFTYEEGTSTKKTTWTSLAKTAANANPVILDANGECDVWIDGNYKFVLAPPTDTDPPTSAVWTYDAVRSVDGTASSATTNKMPINGSFEDDTDADGEPDNWVIANYSAGTVELDSTASTSGSISLKFTSGGAGGGSAKTQDYYEVEAGKVIGVRFSIKSANADTFNKVEVYWYDSDQTYLSTSTPYSDNATNPTSWTRKYTTATAPATAKYARLGIFGVDPTSATHSSTSFDNIELDTSFTGEITATSAELNIMDGVTASTAELNILDGVTVTTAEINVLDGIPATLTATELGYVDGVTSAIQTQFTNTNTTSNILSLYASATAGAVGTYMFARSTAAADVAFGSTIAGSSLTPISAVAIFSIAGTPASSTMTAGAAQSGTWRAMGTYDDVEGSGNGATLWLRIS